MAKKYLLIIFTLSFLFTNFCYASEFAFEDFLGTLAGKQTLRKILLKDEKETYTRLFEKFGPLDIREEIVQASQEGFQARGEKYWQQGGFFRTLKTLQNKDAYLSSAHYVLNQFKEPLEKISGLPMQELEVQADNFGINYIIHHYFDCIKMPQEGDLALYQKAENCPHVGIYRKSNPRDKSPYGGTIESKWGLFSPYIFQHDVFFVPKYYGDVVEFYRLKESINLQEESFAYPLLPSMNINGYLEFDPSQENVRIREEISKSFGSDLEKIPGIFRPRHIQFSSGFCYDYAFKVIFKTSYLPQSEFSSPNNNWIEKYFSLTLEPQKGDLVCYYTECLVSPVHYGIYIGGGLIESKWGQDAVYRHLPFYVGNRYGNFIRYYRLNPGITLKSVEKAEEEALACGSAIVF